MGDDMRARQRVVRSCVTALALLLQPVIPLRAEEDLDWQAWSGEGAAQLVYGVAESDFVLLSFACDSAQGPIVVTFPYEPNGAREGASYQLVLEAGSRTLTVETVGTRLQMDDLFILEGKLARGADLQGLLGQGGMLKVRFGTDVTELPLKSAQKPSKNFFATCKS